MNSPRDSLQVHSAVLKADQLFSNFAADNMDFGCSEHHHYSGCKSCERLLKPYPTFIPSYESVQQGRLN